MCLLWFLCEVARIYLCVCVCVFESVLCLISCLFICGRAYVLDCFFVCVRYCV